MWHLICVGHLNSKVNTLMKADVQPCRQQYVATLIEHCGRSSKAVHYHSLKVRFRKWKYPVPAGEVQNVQRAKNSAEGLRSRVLCASACVTLKDRKRSLSGKKTTTTRCGIRETATTRNCVLWLILNNNNALWHERKNHNAKCLLNEPFISLVIY